MVRHLGTRAIYGAGIVLSRVSQKVLSVIQILKSAGARVGIVFHDVEPYQGTRLIDSIRRLFQVRTMRCALVLCDLAIFTVPPAKLSWIHVISPSLAFVPVGANLPIPTHSVAVPARDGVPTIAVFSITGGKSGTRETEIILGTVRYAAEKLGKLRLLVLDVTQNFGKARCRMACEISP